jgi:hypothetical protein
MITVYSYKSGSTPLRAFPGFHLAWLKGNDKGNEKANERAPIAHLQTRFIDAETASHPVFA